MAEEVIVRLVGEGAASTDWIDIGAEPIVFVGKLVVVTV